MVMINGAIEIQNNASDDVFVTYQTERMRKSNIANTVVTGTHN